MNFSAVRILLFRYLIEKEARYVESCRISYVALKEGVEGRIRKRGNEEEEDILKEKMEVKKL